MSGPRSCSTPFDFAEIAANAASSIWPAPGTVRSIRNLGIGVSFWSDCRYVVPTVRTPSGAVMGRSPQVTSPSVADSGVRLTDVFMALSLATDLGFGQPPEHMLRAARLAMRLGDRLGLDPYEQATLYDVSILTYVGCP